MDTLKLAVGWSTLIIIALIFVCIAYSIIANKIALTDLIADNEGYASMGRFQALVFTIVVAFSFLFFVTAPDATGFPEVPGSVLTLLGLSGTTFLVSKGIDKP